MFFIEWSSERYTCAIACLDVDVLCSYHLSAFETDRRCDHVTGFNPDVSLALRFSRILLTYASSPGNAWCFTFFHIVAKPIVATIPLFPVSFPRYFAGPSHRPEVLWFRQPL